MSVCPGPWSSWGLGKTVMMGRESISGCGAAHLSVSSLLLYSFVDTVLAASRVPATSAASAPDLGGRQHSILSHDLLQTPAGFYFTPFTDEEAGTLEH